MADELSLEQAAMLTRENHFSAWTELRGYVHCAVIDGNGIDPVSLLAYMDELRERANAPLAEAMRRLGGASCTCGGPIFGGSTPDPSCPVHGRTAGGGDRG